MKEFDVIKNIWQEQQDPELSQDEILRRIKRSRNRLANKLLLEVLLMSLGIAVLCYSWYMIPFRMWTTHLALLIFMACSLFVLFAQLSAYRSIHQHGELMSKPQAYITRLKKFQKERYQLNTQKYLVYTLFFGLGLLLFFIEIFFVSSLLLTILGLGVSMVWIVVCYFWLMKKYLRKEQSYLNEMITNLERISDQFST